MSLVTTYYDILGLDSSCSDADIKQAFRRKAKTIHPDVLGGSDESLELMQQLIQAYEVLSDAQLREEYDRRHFIVPGEFRFDYREFLRGRPEDLASQAKLIFFDLLHDVTDEAIKTHEHYFLRRGQRIGDFLPREDYMDCSFLLAEEYQRRGALLLAYQLLMDLVVEEQRESYFRHFFVEVVDTLKQLVCIEMPRRFSNRQALICIDEMVSQGFSNRDTAYFLKKAAEIHLDDGNDGLALTYVRRSLALDPRVPGGQRLSERLEERQFAS